jgi:hypothetical protein
MFNKISTYNYDTTLKQILYSYLQWCMIAIKRKTGQDYVLHYVLQETWTICIFNEDVGSQYMKFQNFINT